MRLQPIFNLPSLSGARRAQVPGAAKPEQDNSSDSEGGGPSKRKPVGPQDSDSEDLVDEQDMPLQPPEESKESKEGTSMEPSADKISPGRSDLLSVSPGVSPGRQQDNQSQAYSSQRQKFLAPLLPVSKQKLETLSSLQDSPEPVSLPRGLPGLSGLPPALQSLPFGNRMTPLPLNMLVNLKSRENRMNTPALSKSSASNEQVNPVVVSRILMQSPAYRSKEDTKMLDVYFRPKVAELGKGIPNFNARLATLKLTEKLTAHSYKRGTILYRDDQTNKSVIFVLSGKAQLLVKKTEDKIRNELEDIHFQLKMEEYSGLAGTHQDKPQMTPWEEFEAKKGDLFKMLYTKPEYFNQTPFLALYGQDMVFAEGSQFGETWNASVDADRPNAATEEIPPPKAVVAVSSLLTVAKIDLLEYDTIFERKSVEESESIKISTFMNDNFFPLEGNANLFLKVVASSRKISVLFRESCFQSGDKQSHIYFVFEGTVQLVFQKEYQTEAVEAASQTRTKLQNELSKENQKLSMFFVKVKKKQKNKPMAVNLAEGCMIGAENISFKSSQLNPTFKYSCISNSYRVTLLAISLESIRSFCSQYPVFNYFMRRKIRESQAAMKERIQRLVEEISNFDRVLSRVEEDNPPVPSHENVDETDTLNSAGGPMKAQYKVVLPPELASLPSVQLWRKLPPEIQERLGLENEHEKSMLQKKKKVLQLMEQQTSNQAQEVSIMRESSLIIGYKLQNILMNRSLDALRRLADKTIGEDEASVAEHTMVDNSLVAPASEMLRNDQTRSLSPVSRLAQRRPSNSDIFDLSNISLPKLLTRFQKQSL